ncbi:MAG: hypothetical protein WBD99_02015 [Thermodesulfobacteriota bacterium]
MQYTLRIIFVLGVIVSLTACGPKIISFQASPQRICKGQHTIVSWDVKGGAVLLAEPPTSSTGLTPSSGSQRFRVSETTTFTIIAMRNGKEDAYARQEVVTFAVGDTKEIVIKTKPEGADGLVAIETLRPEVWDDLVRIDTITGQSDRTLRVLHVGLEVNLPADGSSSDKMRGAKMSGLWEIHAKLLPGEVMGDPARAPPDRLRLLVRLSCIDQEE